MGLHLLEQSICGGLAAAGFGVLFNIRFREIPWCAAGGALALGLRTAVVDKGESLEAASFVAALALGIAVQLLPARIGLSRTVLHVVGCIPMVPGAFAAKAILGLFAITVAHATETNEMVIAALSNSLHVVLTMGALGTGVAIPTLLLRMRKVVHVGSAR